MPSDDHLSANLALLSPAVEALRASIGSTTEEARRQLATLATLAESVAQQVEELRRLQALAAPTATPPSTGTTLAAASAHRADKLAAWLVQQADLSDLS